MAVPIEANRLVDVSARHGDGPTDRVEGILRDGLVGWRAPLDAGTVSLVDRFHLDGDPVRHAERYRTSGF